MRWFSVILLGLLCACGQVRPPPSLPAAPVDWLVEAPPLDLRGAALPEDGVAERILAYSPPLHRVQLTPAQLCAPGVLFALQQRPEAPIVEVSEPPYSAQPAPVRSVRWSTVPCASALSATGLRWSLALAAFDMSDYSGLPSHIDELTLDVGPAGVAWVASVYPQLRVLRLQGNDLNDDSLAPLHSMPALERLDVRWTKVNGEDPSLLPLWQRLRGVSVRRAPRDALVWDATQLEFLDVAQERMVRVEDLLRLTRLHTLVAPENVGIHHADPPSVRSTDWSSAAGLPLRRLTLRGKLWAGSQLESLAHFPQLEMLTLADSWTDDAALACVLPHLPRLQWFDVQDTAITDASVPVLASHSSLVWVDLRFTRVQQATLPPGPRPVWVWDAPRNPARVKSMPPDRRVSLSVDVSPDRPCGLPSLR